MRRAWWTCSRIFSVWRIEYFCRARSSPQLSVFWQTTRTGVDAAIDGRRAVVQVPVVLLMLSIRCRIASP